MDGVSIFRHMEGGQTKSKLGRERGREGREEGCEEMINLHSTAASGQRQLEPQSTAEERRGGEGGAAASLIENTLGCKTGKPGKRAERCCARADHYSARAGGQRGKKRGSRTR